MPMAPAEKLYIQVRIRLFIDGEEQALDQLWSDAGPVSRLHDAKPYFTMSAALRKSQELLSQKTMEYQVVAADVVSESSITIARGVAQ